MSKKKHQVKRNWSKRERDLVMSLHEREMYKTISETLAVKGFDRSPEAIRKFVKRELKRQQMCVDTQEQGYSAPEIDHVRSSDDVDFDFLDSMSDLRRKRQRISNIITKRYAKIGNPSGKLHKVVSISDLHIPWVNDNVIADMLNQHSDAEVLVVNGDFLDQYSVSKWKKNKPILLRHEYEIGIEYLKQFSKIFKKVVLTRGNHDERLQNHFSHNLDPNVAFMTHPDLLERMANGYTFNYDGDLVKSYNFDNVFYTGGTSGWYAKVGNCIFVHPKGGSKIPMRVAVNAADYFWEKENFDCIVSGHTHKLGKLIWKGKLLMESGCCCVPMDYEADAAMKYSQQAFGYAVVYMNSKGEVDFNKSNPVYYGTATAVDTDIRMSVGD